jgi:hypothetical protein
MELTQQLRDFAVERGLDETEAIETGMKEKSNQFRAKRELYVTGE